MQQRVITIILATGLCYSLFTLAAGMASWRLPDNEQGYSPVQPIDYSHRLHAGELQIDCQFCHTAANKSRHAGIPSSDMTMVCEHRKRAMWCPSSPLKVRAMAEKNDVLSS